MLPFIDKHFKQLLKNYYRNRREDIINEAIAGYIATHHPNQELVDALRKKLQQDIETAMAYGNGSTIDSGIDRARWLFWLTAILSTLATLPFVAFPIATPGLLFILPVVLTVITYVVTVGTIPVSYNNLMRGAMDASIIAFDQNRKNNSNNASSFPPLPGVQQEINATPQQRDTSSDSKTDITVVNKSYSPGSVVRGMMFWKSSGDKNKRAGYDEVATELRAVTTRP